jgi:Ca-activated chloride channel family protein
MLTYRSDPASSGTFMLVLTPGLDLQPLREGVDYSFVLDVSASMAGKLPTLRDGMKRAVRRLRPEDRFRIALFNDHASWMKGSWTAGDWISATPEHVGQALSALDTLRTGGSTNLYEGLDLGLMDLDEGRTTNVILVTDGVTNTGIVDPASFHSPMQDTDVRIFGFLLGNSANWPLMQTICDASGGFYKPISASDDLFGQIRSPRAK